MDAIDSRKVTLASVSIRNPRFPETLVIGEELGKGSNNVVFRATLGDGAPCVLRAPRRRSDTQNKGSAEWELRCTLRAAQLGVAPKVHEVWFAKHAKGRWTSGLYFVTDRCSGDLDELLTNHPREVVEGHLSSIGSLAVEKLRRLADEGIFVYDLKPSNFMVTLPTEEREQLDISIVDFGNDFCEWNGCDGADTPVSDMLRREMKGEEDVDDRIRHILFAAMLVQLSSTTMQRLREERRSHRMDRDVRRETNPFATHAHRLLTSMQGRHISLLRKVLRHDAVKAVMQHYHSRRDASTRRVMRFARGVEVGPGQRGAPREVASS